MENKEYLETTFPDGTPVKIYPSIGESTPTVSHIDNVIPSEPFFMERVVAYDHREGFAKPITWKEYITMFAQLIYNDTTLYVK